MSSWGFEVELHNVLTYVFVVEIIISGPDDTIIRRIIPPAEICIGMDFSTERNGFFIVYQEICKALGLRPVEPTPNEYNYYFTLYGECLYYWNAADGTLPPIPCKWSVDHASLGRSAEFSEFSVPELIIGPVADHPVGTQTRRRIAQNAKEIVVNILDHIQEHYPPREYRCTLALRCLLNLLKRTVQVNPPTTLLPEGLKIKALARSEFRNNPYVPKGHDLSHLFPQLTMSIDLTHFADPYIAQAGNLFYTLYIIAPQNNTPIYRQHAAYELSILAFSSNLVQQCVRYAEEYFPMTAGQEPIAQPQFGHGWTKGAIGLACFSVFNLCCSIRDPAGSSPKNLWMLMPKTSIITILIGIAQHDPGYYASLFYAAFLIVQKTDLNPAFTSILHTTCIDVGTAFDEMNEHFLDDTLAATRINLWLRREQEDTITPFPPFFPDFEPKEGQFPRHLLIGLLGLAWQAAFNLFKPEIQQRLLAAYPITVLASNQIAAALVTVAWFPIASSAFHQPRLLIRTPGAGEGRPKFEFRALSTLTNVTEWKQLVSALVPVAEAMTIPSQWVLDQDRVRRPQTPDSMRPGSASIDPEFIDPEFAVFPARWPYVPKEDDRELPPGTPRAGPAAGPPGTPRAGPDAGPPGTPRAEPTAGPPGTPRAEPAAGPPGTPRAGPAAGPPSTPRAGPAAGPPGTPRAGPAAGPPARPSRSYRSSYRPPRLRPPKSSGSGSDDSD